MLFPVMYSIQYLFYRR